MKVFENKCSEDHRMHGSKTLGVQLSKIEKLKIVIKRTWIKDVENTCSLKAG